MSTILDSLNKFHNFIYSTHVIKVAALPVGAGFLSFCTAIFAKALFKGILDGLAV